MSAHQVRSKTKHRVLIADDDTHYSRRMADFLAHHDCEVRAVRSISEAKECAQFWKPQTIFVSLILPETNALSLVRYIHGRGTAGSRPRIAVMSKQALPEAIEQLSRVGAEHYLIKPFALDEALGVVVQSRAATEFRASDKSSTPQPAFNSVKELHLLNLILRQAMAGGVPERRMFNLMRMINLKLEALRCSLIRYLNEDSALVLASNDDADITGLPLDLSKYPEVRLVRKRQRSVVISNVRNSDVLAGVSSLLARTPFETMVLIPVHFEGRFYGVLSLRMEAKEARDIYYVEKFGQVCAQIISLSLSIPARSQPALARE